MTKQRKQMILAGVLLLVLVLALGITYYVLRDRPAPGEKIITVYLDTGRGSDIAYNIATREEYLRGALEQEALIEGDEGPYGLFVKTVLGVTADESKQEWWKFSKDDEMLNTGVDQTPIHDGDVFKIELATGYTS